jgi:hypothetical protein
MATTTLSNGRVITTFPRPPAGFDVDKASDSELATFGIPRFRPGSKAHRHFSDLARRGAFVEPVFTPLQQKKRWPRRLSPDLVPAPVSGAPMSYGSWAGGIVFAPAVGTPEADRIGWIEGTWVIPELVAGPAGVEPGFIYNLDIRVGLGGWLSQDMLELVCLVEGIGGDDGRSINSPQISAGCFWWPDDLISFKPIGSDTLSFSPGDELYCVICYLPLYFEWLFPGVTDALVLLENMSQGWAVYFDAPPPTDVLPFHGTSGEWIVGDYTLTELDASTFVDFTPPVTFLDCLTVTASGAEIDSASGDTINATDADGNTVLAASLPASNRVQVQFV